MSKPVFKYNSHGVKSSCDQYRNIKGIHYQQWTYRTEDFTEEQAIAKDLGLKTRIINGELYREVN